MRRLSLLSLLVLVCAMPVDAQWINGYRGLPLLVECHTLRPNPDERIILKPGRDHVPNGDVHSPQPARPQLRVPEHYGAAPRRQ